VTWDTGSEPGHPAYLDTNSDYNVTTNTPPNYYWAVSRNSTPTNMSPVNEVFYCYTINYAYYVDSYYKNCAGGGCINWVSCEECQPPPYSRCWKRFNAIRSDGAVVHLRAKSDPANCP